MRFRALLFLALFLLSLPALADQLQNGNAAFERKDYQAALKLLQPLAKRGNAEAQWKLGTMYERGFGVKQNDVEGRKWLRKAADQGSPEAEFFLGALCWNDQDYPEAEKWLRKAADKGKTDAYATLGRMYGFGLGGADRDVAEAYFWLSLAASSGKEPYPVRGTLTRWYLRALLTSEQRAAVDKRLQEWKPVAAPATTLAPAPAAPTGK